MKIPCCICGYGSPLGDTWQRQYPAGRDLMCGLCFEWSMLIFARAV